MLPENETLVKGLADTLIEKINECANGWGRMDSWAKKVIIALALERVEDNYKMTVQELQKLVTLSRRIIQ